MRCRISDNIKFDPRPEFQNYIYKRFRFQFDNLFNAGETAKNNTEFEKLYITDFEFEDQIDKILHSINSTAQFCVGYTGIGKTTSIRHCFQLGVSNAPTLTTPSRLTESKYMVIFPTFLDGYIQPVEEHFDLSYRVSAVCTAMEMAHPELQEIYKTPEELRAFYKFIQVHTPHILEMQDSILELPNSSEEDYIIKKLDKTMKYFPLDYYACKLKYYILKKYDLYDRLIIILDDVETMPEVFQERIILDYFHLFNCMNITEYPQDSNYRVNLLISLRPHTYRIFSNGMRGRRLGAYPLENPIIKKNPVDLNCLFKNRFDYYTSMLPNIAGNLESWRESYNGLMIINRLFDGQYKTMISNLCFMNVRTSLTEYAKILANRFWIQENHDNLGAFRVSPNDCKITNVTIVRAIGCGNSKVFTGENNSIIPNFFYTTLDYDYSIQCLLVMQYFFRNMRIFTGGSVEYGLDTQELRNVYAEWKCILDEERVKQLSIAVRHLFECKILRKSIMDFDDYQMLDTLESIDETSRLYISPLGTELMNMLRRDSILLEMLRECAWRNYSGQDSDYFSECSYDLIRNGKQNELFMDLLEYVDTLRQMEEEFFFSQEGINLYGYCNLFGENLVVEWLFAGIENSLRATGKIYNSLIAKKYYEVNERIAESKTRLLEGK